eukprot:385323-Rhodomonas_salina.2
MSGGAGGGGGGGGGEAEAVCARRHGLAAQPLLDLGQRAAPGGARDSCQLPRRRPPHPAPHAPRVQGGPGQAPRGRRRECVLASCVSAERLTRRGH